MDGRICIWEGFTGKLVSFCISNSDLNCGDICPEGKILAVGTTKSVVQFFDITNRTQLRLVGVRRLYKKDKPIQEVRYSPDGKIIAVSSNSKRIFFLYGNPMLEFSILGKIRFQMEVASFVWSESKKMPGEKLGILALTTEGLLFAFTAPSTTERWINKDLTLDICPLFFRRIDFLVNKICALDQNGDVLVTGKDRTIKRYKIPDENLVKSTDLKAKLPGNPTEEVQALSLPANQLVYNASLNKVLLAGEDGVISLRSIEKLDEVNDHNTFKAHNYKSKGVSVLAVSSHGPFIYSAGFDGSIFTWAISDEEAPEIEVI